MLRYVRHVSGGNRQFAQISVCSGLSVRSCASSALELQVNALVERRIALKVRAAHAAGVTAAGAFRKGAESTFASESSSLRLASLIFSVAGALAC